jgi:cytochrome d ubiquinol oxidase subunit I
MGRFGAAYGIPFVVEGVFFFLEAIFIAIYIYGWKRMRPWPHFWTGLPVVLAGAGGTASVVAANSWMNQPGGITLQNGTVVAVNPWAVFFNRAFWFETVHMLLAAYIVAGFVVAGVYAVGLLKGRQDRYHQLGFLIPFTVAALVTPAQVVVGDLVTREVFHREPAKFAAIEALPTTSDHVPETLGGFIIDGQVRFGLRIPSAASLLAGYRTDTRVAGLDAIPADVRPADRLVNIVHLSFDVMVATAFALLGLATWFGAVWWRRRRWPQTRWFLRAAAMAGVLSVVSLEAGWIVTEVGRQPWTINGLLLTRDAVTTSGNVWLFFTGTVVIYTAVTIGTVYALRALQRRWQSGDETDTNLPYGPRHRGGTAFVAGAGDTR